MKNSCQPFFTSQFVQESPEILLENYNFKLIRSLSSLVNSVERSTQIDFSKLKEAIATIRPQKKINQTLYALHAFLQEGIRNGEGRTVMAMLKNIEQLFKQGDIYARPFSIHTLSPDEVEKSVLNDLQKHNLYKDGKLPSLSALNSDEITRLSSQILHSLECLKKASPLFYHEFETYVADIRLFRSNWLVGMTDVRVFGTIYLCVPDKNIPEQIYFCEHIIHETSHLHLHTLFAIDPIVLNNPDERYTAPIRPDPRPMYGVFHATFVLSRMVRLFMLLSETSQIFEEYFHLFLKRFLNGYNTVKQFGTLTQLGNKIVESYADLIDICAVAHA